MKNLMVAVWIVLLFFTYSCSKDNNNEVQSLQVSQTGTVHIGQPVTFTFPSVAVNSNVDWSVGNTTSYSPVTMTRNGSSVLVRFTKAGSYTVTGTLATKTATSQIDVDSVNYIPVNGTTVQSFNPDEQIRITASRNDSSATASGLIFSMQTVAVTVVKAAVCRLHLLMEMAHIQ